MSSSKTIIKLQSSDDVEISVERVVAERSIVIKDVLKDLGDEALDDVIPLAEVTEPVLRKVLEWCQRHRDDPPVPMEDNPEATRQLVLDEWDVSFLQVEQEMLFSIILAANYLEIKRLLDMGCKVVANMIKGKSPQEIRDTFGIENNLTPEEEARILKENEWAEDR